MHPIDVLIVGSGPAGIATALHLLQLDSSWAERMIVVDKAVHPREKLCGGGITPLGDQALAKLGLEVEVPQIPIHEVALTYHTISHVFRGSPMFRVVRRDEFDHWLVQQVERQGVIVRQGEAVLDIAPQTDWVEVTTDKTIFRAQIVVAADGSRSFVRQKLKWNDDLRMARLLEVLTPRIY